MEHRRHASAEVYRTSAAGMELSAQLMTEMTNLTASLHALNGGPEG